MKKKNLVEVEVKIPNSWADITYNDYMKFYNDIKPWTGTAEFASKVNEKAAFYFCNVSPDVLYKLPAAVLDKVLEKISTFVNLKYNDMPLIKSFTVEDTEYGFIPALDEMSYGEYLDLVNYCKDVIPNVPMIFSVLYRPITRHHKTDYLISEYSGTSDASIAMMKHVLTMDIVFGALGFFLDLLKDLLNYTLTYTTTQLTKMDKQSRATLKGLAKNGVDITQSHSYLVKMLRDLTQLLDSTSINV